MAPHNPYRTGIPTSSYMGSSGHPDDNDSDHDVPAHLDPRPVPVSAPVSAPVMPGPPRTTSSPLQYPPSTVVSGPQVPISRHSAAAPPPVLNFPKAYPDDRERRTSQPISQPNVAPQYPQGLHPTTHYIPRTSYQPYPQDSELNSSSHNLFSGVDTSYHSAYPESDDGRTTPQFSQYDPWKGSQYSDNNQLLSDVNGTNTFVSPADVEAQQEPQRRLNVFGIPMSDGAWDEYADEENSSLQIPINGDEYALNTWDDETDSGEMDMKSEGQDLGEGFGDSEDDAETEEDMAQKAIQAKRVKLYKGNLVLDCPVSDKLLALYPEHQPAREFTHMRYSAATSDPADFGASDFTLRQMCYSMPRETELCIAITIYNEDDVLLARTLQGVFNNIRHLCNRSKSKIWGAEAWKKVVVMVIADGREKMNPRAKALMAALGVYQEGFAKNMVNDKPVDAHIYEYTTMVRIAKVDDTVKLTAEKATPVQMIFCLKEKNKKKINSHRWLFQAFSPILKPKVCVLLDAGTRPGNHSIYHLWKAFDRNPRIGGACGEIAAALGPGYGKLINPLVAAQNFEYKMSNILDKPCESVFGFITVLPGAFSAYRYEALLNDDRGIGPLEKYFKGEKLEADGGIFSSNMYLAEDRVLCWELVAKKGYDWLLEYVKSAKAHTDVPERLSELVLQRRRWLNGSFFASIYAQAHMFQIWRTNHPLLHKLAFHLEFLYQTFTLLFSWFSLGNFFLVFKILTAALGDPSVGFAPGKVLSVVLTWIYAGCLIATFVLSFGNRPNGTKWFYNMIVGFFAVLMAYIVFAAIFIAVKSIQYTICINEGFKPSLLIKDKTFRDLLISLLATYALYVISSVLFFEPWHIITSFAQYILLSPAYINVFNVYAFSNTHDISWGTKGDTAMKTDLGIVKADDAGKIEVELPTSADLVDSHYMDEINILSSPAIAEKKEPNRDEQRADYYALFRSSVVLVWGFMNIALIAVVLNVGGFEKILPQASTTPAGQSGQFNNGQWNPGTRRVRRDTVLDLNPRAGQCVSVNTATTETTQVYLAVILWSVAAMAAYRFIFCIVFLIKRMFH